jgi:hypothetical protein
LDDGEGNDPDLVYDTGRKALTNLITLVGLETGNSYQVTVRQVNEIGESDDSNILTVHAGIVPTKIQSLLWETSTSTSVTVKWTQPESNGGLSLTQFTLYYDVGQTGTY